MKHFKNHKTGILLTLISLCILLILSAVRLVPALKTAKNAASEKTILDGEKENYTQGWHDPVIKNKLKELQWLEQQLLLAKSDSLNLGINLVDSFVQVQLKGTVLLEAQILQQDPVQFISAPEYPAYINLTSGSEIVSENSNIPKKPIKKVKAPKNENEATGFQHDTIPVPPLVWKFRLDNEIEVVITGVALNKDSVLVFTPQKDRVRYRFDELKENVRPKNYVPTLYLWLNDTEAKAIYRAIPEKGKVVLKI